MSLPFAPTLRAAERFMKKVAVDPNGCWLWTACTAGNGYGQFRYLDGVCVAHRISFEWTFGFLPPELDHICRQRCCVNPFHLNPVSHRDNVLRGTSPSAINAAKAVCSRGHEFTPANTYYKVRGRECRQCRAIYRTRYLATHPERKLASS